ncbi:uncharacterized protein LOC128558904 [Mercenaria mercenaria]|uniref:uncharacterized protein LOC128558904 n=1 Tax=Mercenaria mercenaria TaxID=6596 RepID=UPI00234E7BBA|nr:uncharacterized protein LOC128558904 [Mercenaria mercenaria]
MSFGRLFHTLTASKQKEFLPYLVVLTCGSSRISMPDHSMLSWKITDFCTNKAVNETLPFEPYDKFDVTNVPVDFLNDNVLAEVNAVIDKLEQERLWVKSKQREEKVSCKSEYVSIRKLFDREVQRAKRFYWYNMQQELLTECNVDNTKFWKSNGKVGVWHCKKQSIPNEVVLNNGNISCSLSDVLHKWQSDFSSLFHNDNVSNFAANVNGTRSSDVFLPFNEPISILEVKKRPLIKLNTVKLRVLDNIPSEVLKNNTAILFLHSLFSICFSNGIVPTIWGKSIINPIPKSGSADSRDPLSYRGIALAFSMYKIYCTILNDRLNVWVEGNVKLVDELNAFREKRSTIDQISSLTNLIEIRKKLHKSTFSAFIDLRKAYDCINREKLWVKLREIGISGKMLTAVKALYSSVYACVRVNSFKTDWFSVQTGLRQGCMLSPILFNLYINDLALYLKSLAIGVSFENENICILMYADDIVLLAENAHDLQTLLNALNDWCNTNYMNINNGKSKVIYFRPVSVPRSNCIFMCGNVIVDTVDKYIYLGIVLNEFLDYNVTAKAVAQSVCRALGLVIAKCKAIGGVPYDIYSKLYDTLVWPVINYGAAIWGYRSYSCINAVHNRAMRFFLCVGKYTPSVALAGELAWQHPIVRQHKTVSNFWVRLCNTSADRINKRIAQWAISKSRVSCKNWFFYVRNILTECNLNNYVA